MSLEAELQDTSGLQRWLDQRLETLGLLPNHPLPFRNIKFGTGSVVWAGGTELSEATSIEHKLGEVPAVVFIQRAEQVHAGSNYFEQFGYEADDTDLSVTATTVTGAIPGEGGQVHFSWLVAC